LEASIFFREGLIDEGCKSWQRGASKVCGTDIAGVDIIYDFRERGVL